jgi:hypothetical protein
MASSLVSGLCLVLSVLACSHLVVRLCSGCCLSACPDAAAADSIIARKRLKHAVHLTCKTRSVFVSVPLSSAAAFSCWARDIIAQSRPCLAPPLPRMQLAR